MNALFHCIIEFLFKAVRPILQFLMWAQIILKNIYLLQILFYYFFYNTVYSVCCKYTSCNLKQKQGSNCVLSIRRKWFLFIHIVPGNIVDFWNSDLLKETQTFWKSHNWTFLLHEFVSLPSSLHDFLFLGIFPCMNFFLSPPPPPITFLMVRPLPLNGPFTFHFFWVCILMQMTNKTSQTTAFRHKACN